MGYILLPAIRVGVILTRDMQNILQQLNVMRECRSLHLRLWLCPPFLFLVMGIITITSMISTYLIASQIVEEPQLAALIVIGVTCILLVFGYFIINSFNRIVEANRMKSEFISIVSHQLRSPLSIFKWTLDLMEREHKEGKDYHDMENLMQTLANTTENMNRLVNTLLEVSRIEAKTFVLRREEVSLAELTESILKDFRKYAESTNVHLVLEPSDSLPKVYTDSQRISMAIYNFIDNAIRYTPGSGSILITIEKEGGRIRWNIRDQGVGIPKEQQERIFQKFFRATTGTKIQTGGSGLGLYIARSIIEASGGTTGFSSEEGRGSTFWFVLPIK